MSRCRCVLGVGLVFLLACQQEESPVMEPGENCQRCHSDGNDEGAQTWTVAGTAFRSPESSKESGVQGLEVVVTDSRGRTLTLETNGAGNFYTAESMVPPLRARIQGGGRVMAMSREVPTGACNTCHTVPPQEAAPGRIFLP